MALDELGADPYQRAAMRCARGAFITCILSVMASIASLVLRPEGYVLLAAGAAGLCGVSLGVGCHSLRKEGLSVTDLC